jgi:hypothetical protein
MHVMVGEEEVDAQCPVDRDGSVASREQAGVNGLESRCRRQEFWGLKWGHVFLPWDKVCLTNDLQWVWKMTQ